MKKTYSLAVLAATTLASQAAIIWTDDFQSYAVANPATSPLTGVSGVDWTPSSASSNAHRIFDTGNFGGTRLWISNVNGTSLTSSGTAVADNTTYTFDFFSALETSNAGASGSGRVEILIGTDIGSASVVNTLDYTARGDDWDIANSKDDHQFSIDTTVTSAGAGDQIFVRFTRVSASSWFAVDDVSLDAVAVPEPSSTALLGFGGLSLLLRRRR